MDSMESDNIEYMEIDDTDSVSGQPARQVPPQTPMESGMELFNNIINKDTIPKESLKRALEIKKSERKKASGTAVWKGEIPLPRFQGVVFPSRPAYQKCRRNWTNRHTCPIHSTWVGLSSLADGLSPIATGSGNGCIALDQWHRKKRLTGARGVQKVGKQTRSDPMESALPGKSQSDSRKSVRAWQKISLSHEAKQAHASREIYIDYYMLGAWYRFYARVFNTISRTSESSSEWAVWY